MANIQQSLNAMLASAQTGAFIAQQSPAYKQYAQTNLVKKEQKSLEEQGAELEKILESPEIENGTQLPESAAEKRFQAAAKQSDIVDKRYSENQYKLFELTGDKKYLDQALKYSSSNLAEEVEASKIVKPLVQKQNTLRSQFESIIERRDILSAKERGQLDTMYHKHLKKGELD